ncbi:MAG: STAS domain-containing protein [Planctomycetota bacterium]|nr:STAS domain-containing protein [Planctomycetota bacterium]
MTDSNLVVREDSGVTIVGFGGSTLIDAEHIEQIAGELYELIDKQKANRLVLDFSSVKFLASRMLGVLLTLKKKSEAQQGGLALCAVREDLMKVFAVTNLDRTFSFFADEATALAQFQE